MPERSTWLDEAAFLGYGSEKEMLYDLYITKGHSLEAIAKKLGYSVGAMRRHLQAHNIEIKRRGGDNRSHKKRLLEDVTDAELLKYDKCAAAHGCHRSAVFREIRRRKEEGTWTFAQSDLLKSLDSSQIQDIISCLDSGGDTNPTESTTSSEDEKGISSSSTTEHTN